MNFVLGFDDNYSPFADTTIVSICVNNFEEHNFYVITDYLSDENKEKIERDVKRYGSNIIFIYINESDTKEFPLGPHMANNYISIATYFRLFMIDKLPKEVQRVIYLDCDTIVNGSLDLMWNWEFEKGHCILAANDEPKNAVLSARRLGYDVSYSYFNAGVLMVDLIKLRQYLNKDIISNYIKENFGVIKFHDQDILNALLYDKRDILPVEYDMLEVYYVKGHSTSNGCEIASDILKNPAVVHYSGPIKPWHIECKHPLKSNFNKYLNLTSFSSFFIPIHKYVGIKERSYFFFKQLVKCLLENLHIKSYSYINIA